MSASTDWFAGLVGAVQDGHSIDAGEWDVPAGFCWTRHWFDQLADQFPARAALDLTLVGGTVVTFGELSAWSTAAAAWLSDRGVLAQQRVMVGLPESLDLWVLRLACDRLGAVYVEVQPELAPADWDFRMELCVPEWTVVARSLTNRSGMRHALPGWPGLRTAERPDSVFDPRLPGWAYFSSGTTGAPKMVLHSRSSYAVGHLSGVAFHRLHAGDRHINLAGPGWAKHAWSSHFVPWATGATIVAGSSLTSADAAKALPAARVTSICASPTRWRSLLPLLKPWPELREATCAGEVADESLRANAGALMGVPLRSVYGLTELTAVLGQLSSEGCLQLLPGYEARLSASGQLAVRSLVPRFLGYVRRDQGWRAHDEDWFDTGDLADACESGYIVRGRVDELVNRDGHLLSPQIPESELEAISGVREAMVYTSPETGRVTAQVVPELGPVTVPDGIVEHIDWVPQLPRTLSGKLCRPRPR